MGFRLPKKTARIKFEGTDYDGAEAEVSLSLSIEQMFHVHDLISGGDIVEGFRNFGEIVLISWNLEDDNGDPIPPTSEGFMSTPDRIFLNIIIDHWVQAMKGVPVPLESQSQGGSTSEAEPTPAATQ